MTEQDDLYHEGGLDLSDPMVRDMADRNHVPQEMRRQGKPSSVHCEACWQPWPCPVRRKLRAIDGPNQPAFGTMPENRT